MRRHAKKRSSLDSRSSSSKSIFMRRMNGSSSGRTMPVRPVLLDIDDLRRMPKRQNGVAKPTKPTSPTAKPIGRSIRKGETMSMLLDVGEKADRR